MKLRDLDYKTEFYWKGERYRQFIRTKKPIHRFFSVLCYKVKTQDRYLFTAGQEVKPVLKPSDIERLK